jgi:nitrite reductase/ring-hydroxylating ferredoxin subunit
MKKNIFLPLVIFLLIISCEKDNNYIPDVSVNIQIDLNNTSFNGLNSIGGYVYITGGYKGIIVYRLSQDQFVAFERACPYHPTTDCGRLQVDTSGLYIYDPICGSRFVITDGSKISGPAKRPAKTYSTYYDGYYLYIRNP